MKAIVRQSATLTLLGEEHNRQDLKSDLRRNRELEGLGSALTAG